VYPPVDVLASLSRLMRKGTGANRTRADHPAAAAQLLAALARARQVRDLAELIGAGALTETDRSYLACATAFTERLVRQGIEESRSLDDTLDRLWSVLSELPRRELTMLPAAAIDAYDHDGPAGDASRAGAGDERHG
jgi:V/A-type H+-transporting ATPase subunit B